MQSKNSVNSQRDNIPQFQIMSYKMDKCSRNFKVQKKKQALYIRTLNELKCSRYGEHVYMNETVKD